MPGSLRVEINLPDGISEMDGESWVFPGGGESDWNG